MSAIITTIGLNKQFRLGGQTIKALDDINVEIEQGQFVVIMGTSGSGKSTLLYSMTGLDTPTSGQVIVAGHALDRIDQQTLAHLRGQMIGFIFQGFYLVPTMTAQENVMLVGTFARHDRTFRYQRSAALLSALQMGERMDHRPNQLSGGQQQRVAIARALYNDPPIIVGDEPTGALDSATGTIIMRLLRRLCTQEGKTVLIVTHDPDMARYADRVIRLQDGRIVQDKLRPIRVPKPTITEPLNEPTI